MERCALVSSRQDISNCPIVFCITNSPWPGRLWECLTAHSSADWSAVDPMEYLTPFIEVIRSPEISGPITGVALTAVSRFLDAYIIGELQDCVLGLTIAAHICCNPCNEDNLSVQLLDRLHR